MKLTAITNPLALRLDTTVGTRIFAGGTMIYGDTGWRNITDLYLTESPDKALEFDPGGGLFIRRTAQTLFVQIRGGVSTTSTTTNAITLPPGWRGSTVNTRTQMQIGQSSVGQVRTTSGNALLFSSMTVGPLFVWNESSTAIIPAAESWPSTLIGLPA